MFCAHCGERLPDGASECSACGETSSAPSPRQTAAAWAETLKTSSWDAGRTLKALLLDPVSELPEAYAGLGTERARAVGVVLCFGFALAASLGLTFGARNWLGFLADVRGGGGFEMFAKSFAALLSVPAAFVISGLVIRKVLRSREGVAADLFTTGTALAPLGLAVLVSGSLGLSNAEVVGLLFLFAFTYLILILYRGITGVGKVAVRAGAPAVPVLLLAASWLTKVVFAAIF